MQSIDFNLLVALDALLAESSVAGAAKRLNLSAPAVSPFEQQTQNDEATQLMQSQRELLQQNPSGTTRQELSIGHALNGFSPH